MNVGSMVLYIYIQLPRGVTQCIYVHVLEVVLNEHAHSKHCTLSRHDSKSVSSVSKLFAKLFLLIDTIAKLFL